MKRSIKYCIYTLLILGTFLVQTGGAAVAKVTGGVVLQKKETFPHKEIKLVRNHFQVIAVNSLHKAGGPGIFHSLLWENSFYAFSNNSIRSFTPDLVKDYLFFIFPSHHFW